MAAIMRVSGGECKTYAAIACSSFAQKKWRQGFLPAAAFTTMCRIASADFLAPETYSIVSYSGKVRNSG